MISRVKKGNLIKGREAKRRVATRRDDGSIVRRELLRSKAKASDGGKIWSKTKL